MSAHHSSTGTAVFYYVSGHGFGHATRSVEVIKSLERLDPSITVCVRTSAPLQLFRDYRPEICVHTGGYDTGVVQSDSLNIDIPCTIADASRIIRLYPDIIAAETAAARAVNCRMIVSDIPSVAGLVAQKLSIPSMVISNFSWDWIYKPWISDYPEIEPVVRRFESDYNCFDRLLRLPFSEKLPAFRAETSIPLIARHSEMDPGEVKKRLSLPNHLPLILLSFGGMGLRSTALHRLADLQGYCFISLTDYDAPGLKINSSTLKAAGLGYPDLVRAVDVVVTKPGYGIVSECAANGTRMLYTDRGPFREYDVIVDQMQEMITSIYIPRRDFSSGNWGSYLEKILSLPATPPVKAEGATRAAELILAAMRDS